MAPKIAYQFMQSRYRLLLKSIRKNEVTSWPSGSSQHAMQVLGIKRKIISKAKDMKLRLIEH